MGCPKDEAHLTAAPLFPLPNVVLFPRAVLPLHIFEERYKAMTAAALRGDRQIAMALLRPGWEKNYHGHPAIEPVVCLGTIITHEKLPDGKYNFLLLGKARARVIDEPAQQDRPYRVANLQPLVETQVAEADLAHDRRRLLRALQTNGLLHTGIGRKFRQMLAEPIATADIADLIAFNFLDDVQLKQSLLADADVHRRVARTVEGFESVHFEIPSTSPVAFCKDPSLN